MKRNNIFMFAYIVFIFLCSSIKPFYDFPMWSRIVVAVTVASWVFAISDCLSCISNIQKEVVDTQLPLVHTAMIKIDFVKKHLIKRNANGSEDSTIEIVESCRKRCESMVSSITKMGRCASFLEKASIFVTFSAFLLFLCAISFDPIYNYFFARQEGFTVLSFGMILLAQFGANIGSNYINNIKKEFTSIVNGWEALLHTYETEEKQNAN